MTLTLELAPEIERVLEEKAQRAGLPVAAYALRVLARDAATPRHTYGKFAHVPVRAEHVHADRRAEVEAEEWRSPERGT